MSKEAMFFNTTPETIALGALAVSLWESETIKKEVKNYFNTNPKQNCFGKNNDKWTDIESKVLNMLSNKKIPENCTWDDMDDTVKIIGQKIFSYTKYVSLDLGLDAKYASEIYWTEECSIDEILIFEKFWSSIPSFNSSRRGKTTLSFRIGCILKPERFILNNNLQKMKNVIHTFSSKIHATERFKHTMNQLFWDLKRQNMQYIYQTVKLFFSSIYVGLDRVVEYLANEALSKHLHHFLNSAVRICLEESVIVENVHVKEKFLRIFLFLSDKLSEGEKCRLYNSTGNILNLFLNVWPYHEYCGKIFDFVSGEKQDVLKTILKCRYVIDQPLLDVQKRPFYKLFENLLAELPKKIKLVFFNQKSVMEPIFNALDFTLLNFIINDKDFSSDQRHAFIELGGNILQKFIEEGRFEVYDNFVREVLRSKDERIIFLQRIKFLWKLIGAEKFDSAEKYLNLVPLAQDRKLRIKKRIDMLRACSASANSDLELAKKLLENKTMDEKKKQCLIKIYDTLLNGVCQIWCRNFSTDKTEAKAITSEFLNRFLKPRQLEYFKKEKILKNENFIHLFISYLTNPEDFGIIDDLCQFCAVPLEKIRSIKLKVVENLNSWIDLYALKDGKFLLIYYLVEWIFENNSEKMEFIGGFINSDAGALLCAKIITEDECKDEVLKLLYEWIRPCPNIDVLMYKIHEMDFGKDDAKKNFIKSMIASVYDEHGNFDEFNGQNDADFEWQRIILADIQLKKIRA